MVVYTFAFEEVEIVTVGRKYLTTVNGTQIYKDSLLEKNDVGAPKQFYASMQDARDARRRRELILKFMEMFSMFSLKPRKLTLKQLEAAAAALGLE